MIRTLIIFTGMLSGWLAIGTELPAQNSDHAFRPFTSSYTPSKLNELLGNSEAVQEKVVADRISEMVLDKFKRLSPEQRKNLVELAQGLSGESDLTDFESRRSRFEEAIRTDPELKQAIEDLRTQFREQPLDQANIDRGEIEEGVRDEVRNRLQQELERIGSGFSGQNSPQPGSGNSPFRFPGSDRDLGTGKAQPLQPGSDSDVPRINSPGGVENRNSPGRNSPQPGSPFSPAPSVREPDGGVVPWKPPVENSPAMPPSAAPGTGSGSSNRPFGGFSDDGSSGDSPTQVEPGQGSASGQDTRPPKESLGHRFNRALLDSVGKAMEKKIGGDEGSTERSFESLFSKFVDAISSSDGNSEAGSGETGSSIWKKIEAGVRGAKGQLSGSGIDWPSVGGSGPSLGPGVGLGMPAVSPRGVLFFLIILGGIVGALFLVFRRTALGQMLGIQSAHRRPAQPPVIPMRIRDYDEAVQLIDRFALWLFGRPASWWHSQKVQQEVARANPALAEEIQTMMQLYDLARYGRGDTQVSPEDLHRITATLSRLRDLAGDSDLEDGRHLMAPNS